MVLFGYLCGINCDIMKENVVVCSKKPDRLEKLQVMWELDTMESERYCVSSSELGEITASEGKWVEPKKLFSASR